MTFPLTLSLQCYCFVIGQQYTPSALQNADCGPILLLNKTRELEDDLMYSTYSSSPHQHCTMCELLVTVQVLSIGGLDNTVKLFPTCLIVLLISDLPPWTYLLHIFM